MGLNLGGPPVQDELDVVTSEKRPAARFRQAWIEWFQKLGIVAIDVQNSGDTRPTENLYDGKPFFDTALGLPIWYLSGTGWVDATGTAV